MKTVIVPATPELLERVYGEKPKNTHQAIVALRGEEIIGVAGVYLGRARYVMFSELSQELRNDKRTIIRGIRLLKQIVSKARLPVYAVANPDIEGSDRLLKHIGFKQEDGEVYVWQ